MSTDHDFEQVLSARLGAAAEPVTGSGVTMTKVEARVAERRAGRRRRQGALALAAAAMVVLGGVGLAAAVDRDRPAGVVADDGTSSTEAPTTEARPTTECVIIDAGVAPGTSLPTTTVMVDETGTTIPADVQGTGPAAQPCPPGTTAPPATTTETTAPPTTPTTAAPELRPGQACEPGSSPDCIDPDGDGTYTYLIGGAECMANPIGDSGNVYAHCIDLDGDGTAGYGDEGEAPGTTQPAAYPGAGCTPGSHPDCIDPEGDGSFVYLIGGGECMASPIGGPMCADLDGDGHAGYPDSEG